MKWNVRYFVIIGLYLLNLSCQKSAEEYYNSAIEYNNQKDLNSAFDEINSAIEIDPNFAAAYFERGKIKFRIYKYEQSKSEQIIDDDLKLNWDTVEENILNDFSTAAKLDKKLASEIYISLGNINFSMNNYQQAIDEYRKTIQIDSTNKEAVINTAMCKSYLGDSKGAKQILDQMVLNDPGNAESYYIRAIMNLEDNSSNYLPCEDLMKALELYDKNAEYFYESFIKNWNLKDNAEKLISINCNG